MIFQYAEVKERVHLPTCQPGGYQVVHQWSPAIHNVDVVNELRIWY